MPRNKNISLCILVAFLSCNAVAIDFETEIKTQTRMFHKVVEGQEYRDLSVHLTSKIEDELSMGYWEFVPFTLLDTEDSDRTHADIREFYWSSYINEFEWKIGISRIFWGVTESLHLVDIINQKDLITNINGESKLGQPMINLSYQTGVGLVEAYILPCYRKLDFGGSKSRLRLVNSELENSDDLACHKSEQGTDWAMRWSHSVDDIDMAISHFYGTQRTPELVSINENLAARYNRLQQSALEILKVNENFIFKLEAVHRQQQSGTSYAWVGGTEYNIVGIAGSRSDVGILVEYQYDQVVDSLNNNDLFLGARLVQNDFDGTELLVGILIDVKDPTSNTVKVEYSRRLNASFFITADAYVFSSDRKQDPGYGLKDEDYLSVSLSYFF